MDCTNHLNLLPC